MMEYLRKSWVPILIGVFALAAVAYAIAFYQPS